MKLQILLYLSNCWGWIFKMFVHFNQYTTLSCRNGTTSLSRQSMKLIRHGKRVRFLVRLWCSACVVRLLMIDLFINRLINWRLVWNIGGHNGNNRIDKRFRFGFSISSGYRSIWRFLHNGVLHYSHRIQEQENAKCLFGKYPKAVSNTIPNYESLHVFSCAKANASPNLTGRVQFTSGMGENEVQFFQVFKNKFILDIQRSR